MTTQLKTRAEDTRARIMESAEALFRRMGFAKTAVADIAAELSMSPANIYRFFPSKIAIVDAICQRCLAEVEDQVRAVVRSDAPASVRLERMVLTILAYHQENLLTERRVHDMVLAAIESSWDAIQAHKESVRRSIEQLLHDGIASGEFEPMDDVPGTARVMVFSLVAYFNPVVIGQCMRDEIDLEAAAKASVRFVLRAITPRN
jgi:AcrR family transcriptional regulator